MKHKFYFLLAIVVLLLAGCGRELPTEKCVYCGTPIYWHAIDETWSGGTNYQKAVVSGTNTHYHPWCAKIMELENRIKILEGN